MRTRKRPSKKEVQSYVDYVECVGRRIQEREETFNAAEFTRGAACWMWQQGLQKFIPSKWLTKESLR